MYTTYKVDQTLFEDNFDACANFYVRNVFLIQQKYVKRRN